ncbi:MAG: JAB domain-containing protein [Pseudosphingobacterium sp.]|nr:JAB domain-containing protein [Pseudosphingobacterium sp.]
MDALKTNARMIILAHNHPSGNLKPSQADVLLTKRICDGGKILGMQVVEHIILSSEGYLSFADEGLI